MAKTQTKKITGRGGSRPGSGRDAMFENKARKTIDFEQSDIQAIEALGFNVSQFVREATVTRIKRLQAIRGKSKK